MTQFLDPLDSAFVLLEVAGSAMNIGAVIELEPGEPSDPEKRFALIRDNVASRIHEIPIFTQRLVRAPFDMTWPILTCCEWSCPPRGRRSSSTSSCRSSFRDH
jgi:hypothetical protein